MAVAQEEDDCWALDTAGKPEPARNFSQSGRRFQPDWGRGEYICRGGRLPGTHSRVYALR